MLSYSNCILIFCVAAVRSASVNYGKHIPQGEAAVDFIYGERGMWKETLPELKYVWNFHRQHATTPHPYNATELRAAATGDERYTARDTNGHLLCDFDKDVEISPVEAANCGFAFHDHSGLSKDGVAIENTYTLFLLDANHVGGYMSKAYGRPESNGTVDHPGEFMRWKILSGDTDGWRRYNSSFFDTMALDGMYYLATSEGADYMAMSKWNDLIFKSRPRWDAATKTYDYTAMQENYWYGLIRILTEWLMTRRASLTEDFYNKLIQQSVSLRAQILNHQEKDSQGVLLGWRFDLNSQTSMITSEGVAVSTLALGVNGKYTFEADSAPMIVGDGFLGDRFPHVVSAVEGESSAGIMSSGPNIPLEIGSQTVQFFLRTTTPVDDLAVVDVYDSTDSKVVNSAVVQANSFFRGNEWSIVEVQVNIEEEGHSYEFRTHWNGQSDLDLAFVRVQ